MYPRKKARKIRIVVLAAAISLGAGVFVSPPVGAGLMKGHDLLEQCMTKLNTPQAQCVFFISGIIEGHLLSIGTGKSFFCMPQKGNAKKTIVKYLRKHAAELDRDAGELVLTALSDAWPCTK